MKAGARKYWTIFSLCISERLTYRTDFFLFTLMRFLPIVTTIFLWQAVFAGSDQSRIAGLTANQMVAYYLLVTVARAFSSMPGLAEGIASDIRDGQIKKYLIQPVDMMGFLLVSRIAHKVVYYGIAIGPFAIVFFLCRGYFDGWPEPAVLGAFALSLVLSFLIGFLFESLVGVLGFWFLEIASFNYIVMMLSYLMSGHMFPLDLVPGVGGWVLQLLPFQYLAYFPAKLFLKGGEMGPGELLGALGGQVAWAAALYALLEFAYAKGLKRYSAYGG